MHERFQPRAWDVGILFLIEQTAAVRNLDSVASGVGFAGTTLNLNLGDSLGPITERGLKLQWFNTASRESLGAGAIAGVINRYSGEWITDEDRQAQANLKLVLAGWAHGQNIVVQIGATKIDNPGVLAPGEVPDYLELAGTGWEILSTLAENWERDPQTGRLQNKGTMAFTISLTILFYLRTVDNAGNRSVPMRYGPFRLDSEEPPSTPVLDGYLDEASNEWLEGERMGHDTRPDSGPQSFYMTRDEYNFYFAWDGVGWNTDGDAFIYFNVDPGPESQGITTTWDYSDTHTLPLYNIERMPNYAFTADYVFYVEGADTWGLMRWMSTTTSWEPITASVTTTLLYGGDQVEISLLKADVGVDTGCAGTETSVLAFAQEEMTGTLISAFPTTNDIFVGLTDYYNWGNLCPSGPPAENQPQAASMVLDGTARPSGAVRRGDAVTYTFTYQNAGLLPIEGLAHVWLTLPSDLDADCDDISGDYNTGLGIQTQGNTCIVPVVQDSPMYVYELPARYTGMLTLTGQVSTTASTGWLTVTGVISHDITSELDWRDNTATPAVEVDATPPQAAFSTEAMEGLFTVQAGGGAIYGGPKMQGPRTLQAAADTVYVGPNMQVLGNASDNRSGVVRIEVDLGDGQGWRDASGTTLWSHAGATAPADGTSLTLRVRATDGVGNRSDEVTLNVVMDSVAPQSAILYPADGSPVPLGQTVPITGTSADARSGVERGGHRDLHPHGPAPPTRWGIRRHQERRWWCRSTKRRTPSALASARPPSRAA